LLVPLGGAHAAASGDSQVGGTGTIVPRGGVVRITGVPGYTIVKIDVQAGQTVAAGAPLFELDDVAAANALQSATNDLEVARKDAESRLAVEAMTVKLMELRLQHAKRDAANYRAVGPGGTSEKEVSRLQQAVEESQINLDVEKARAEQLQLTLLNSVRNAVLRRDTAADSAAHFTVRAPSAGTVLKIDRQVGEQANGETIVEFGDLSAMYVDAQIYQGDMVKVKPGMKVTVKNSAFPNLATGKVENVGRQIGTRSQLGDVRILLDKNAPADRLVGMEVEVVLGQ
jgi:multidrug resistance efflux pump